MGDENEVSNPTLEAKEMDRVRRWLCEIDAALKREKEFRKEGEKLVSLYEAEQPEQYTYNILFSNTETMAPALYNSTPRPKVQRRFKDKDPLGKKAALAVQRVLEYCIDPGSTEFSPFSDQMQMAVLEALVPGRGLTRFKYDAEFAPMEQQETPAENQAAEVQSADDGEDKGPQEQVTREFVLGEEVSWNGFLHGYAKTWSRVPWVAFDHYFSDLEAEQNFGKELAKEIPSVKVTPTGNDGEMTSYKGEEDAAVTLKHVYEIWDKSERKILFICPNYPDKVLKEVDDPLGLDGFFPCPEPLRFLHKISGLTPTALYKEYQEQAKELNAVTMRINRIVRALKVRGVYDSTIQGIDKALEADDNTLIPADNVAALDGRGGTLERAVWLMPIDKLIQVLQQLYLQRQQIKQVIFELTGIADIMRGSTQASETLGAQELKNQWGTLRLKRNQKRVMRYVCDCLRIVAEIAVKKFAPDTLRKMTGLPYPMQGEKEQAQMQVQMAQQQMAMQGVPPEQAQQQLIQQLGPAMQMLQEPSWEEILGLLRDDLQRSYRIDIETNSTIDAEATEDKQDITELVTAISGFLQGIGPLVEKGIMPFEAAKGMLLAIIRRFKFGPELEDELDQMKAPPPPPNPEAEKAKHQMQLEQQKAQLEAQAKQQELELKKQFAAIEVQMKQMELQMKEQELQLKAQEQALKLRGIQMKGQLDEQNMTRQAEFQAQDHQLKMQGAVESHQLKMQQQRDMAAAAKNKPKPAKQGA